LLLRTDGGTRDLAGAPVLVGVLHRHDRFAVVHRVGDVRVIAADPAGGTSSSVMVADAQAAPKRPRIRIVKPAEAKLSDPANPHG
jgi:hypothetical protein